MAFAVEQNIDNCFSSSGTGNTMTSWTPGANEVCLLSVARLEEGTEVTNVAGNGLTWTEVTDVDNGRGVGALSVWRASGASPTTGSVTFDHNTGSPAYAQLVRISGADDSTDNGVEAFGFSGGTGTDDNDMKVSVTTVTNNAFAIAFGGGRGSQTFTADSDETEIFDATSDCGSGGSRMRTNSWHKTSAVTPAGATQMGMDNNLSASVPWCAVALSIKPEAAPATDVSTFSLLGVGPA